MRPTVCFRTPTSGEVTLGHGDLIGRLESAALFLDDPRISEAHAMISLRGMSLKLLALRGRFAVNDRTLVEVELSPGMVIKLARGLSLEVLTLHLPARVLGIRVGSTQVRAVAGVLSLFGRPEARIRPGFHRDATAYLWPGASGLRLQGPVGQAQVLQPGESAEIEGVMLHAVEMTMGPQGPFVTMAHGAVTASLTITNRYHSVHLTRDGEPTLVISGISGRIISELAAFDTPVAWHTVAHEVWPDTQIDGDLRRKWDVNLGRLRKKLSEVRIRRDLVRSDGNGNVELALEAGDSIVDES